VAKRGKRRGDSFRRDLAKLVRQLVEEGHERDRDSEPIAPLLREHLGGGAGARDLPIYTQELDGWELPSLQLALDEIAGREGWDVRVVGIGGQARHYGASAWVSS
jgi:hypothetical protein